MTQITVAREGGFAPGDVIQVDVSYGSIKETSFSLGPWKFSLRRYRQDLQKVVKTDGATLTTKKLPWWSKHYWR